MDELLPLLADVAEGLAYLHERGVLHRDVKAANIFLQRRERPDCEERFSAGAEGNDADSPLEVLRVKLGDFGSCKIASRAQTPVQTPQWMAPEVARLELYGAPADVWSFGIVVFEVLELAVPYGEEITLPELEAELVAGRPPLLSDEARARAGASLAALVDACLLAEPMQRPSAAEAARRLRAAAGEVEEAGRAR